MARKRERRIRMWGLVRPGLTLLATIAWCLVLACGEGNGQPTSPLPRVTFQKEHAFAGDFFRCLGFCGRDNLLYFVTDVKVQFGKDAKSSKVSSRLVKICPASGKIVWKSAERPFVEIKCVFSPKGDTEAVVPYIPGLLSNPVRSVPFLWHLKKGTITRLQMPRGWSEAFLDDFTPDGRSLNGDGILNDDSNDRTPLHIRWDTTTGRYRPMLYSQRKLFRGPPASSPMAGFVRKVYTNPYTIPVGGRFVSKSPPLEFILRPKWITEPKWSWEPVLIDVAKDKIVPRVENSHYQWRVPTHQDLWSLRANANGRIYRLRLAPNGRLVRLPHYKQLPIAIVLDDSPDAYLRRLRRAESSRDIGIGRTTLGIVVRPFGYFERIKAQWLRPPVRPPFPLGFAHPDRWRDRGTVLTAPFSDDLIYVPAPIGFDVLAEIGGVTHQFIDKLFPNFWGTLTDLSPDGRWLVTTKWISAKKTKVPKLEPARVVVQVWDLRPLLKKAAKKWAWATPKGLEKKLGHNLFYRLGAENWKNFEEESLTGCHEILISLANHPKEAVPMIEKWLGPPMKAEDLRKIPQWIKDLDSPRFAVRQKATLALKRLGLAAREAMKKAIKKPASLEQQSRLQQLLENIEERSSGKELALLRIVDALEYMNTPGSRRLLQKIATGSYGTVPAEAAKSSLRLLSRH